MAAENSTSGARQDNQISRTLRRLELSSRLITILDSLFSMAAGVRFHASRRHTDSEFSVSRYVGSDDKSKHAYQGSVSHLTIKLEET